MRTIPVFALLSLIFSLAVHAQTALAPDKTINFLGLDLEKNFTPFLNPKVSLDTDPEKAFRILDDNSLHISGQGWGYLRSNQSFKDYHLVCEYKWGEHTWSGRTGKARDSGIFIHAQGEDGAFGGSWIHAFEVQLIEGGSGNLAVVCPTENPTHTLTASHPLPSAKHGRKAPADYVDPRWSDIQGYRGKDDLENPVGDWNRIEVICHGDSVTVFLNGHEVNRARALNPNHGHLALQSEGAELFIRRFELHPLDTFKETYQPDQSTTETGTGLRPPPPPPTPPQ
jgi:hypothetical protein